MENTNKLLELVEELCDTVDASDQDLGGLRPARTILADIGPALDAAKKERKPNVFTIGIKTMSKVFAPAGISNLSDIQAVMDAVEKVLAEDTATATNWKMEKDSDLTHDLGAARFSADLAGEVKGLPVAGYKPTQSKEAIALVDEGKILEERVLRWIEKVMAKDQTGTQVYRFLSQAQTAIQGGFMFAYRAVFQPDGSRIALPEDVPVATEQDLASQDTRKTEVSEGRRDAMADRLGARMREDGDYVTPVT